MALTITPNEQQIIKNIDDLSKSSVKIPDKIILLYKLSNLIHDPVYSPELYQKLKNSINNDINNFVQFIKMDLFITPALKDNQYLGGDSCHIFEKIKEKWDSSPNKLVITNNKKEILFTFNTTEIKKLEEIPLFGSGTFTAVYVINKFNNLNMEIDKSIDYILRSYINDLPVHMMDSIKIQDEYKRYKKNLIKVYYYGNIFLNDIKQEWDYVITKKYNINFMLLTNRQKFIFLRNIVILLQKFYENNEYWNDLKIDNVACDDIFELNPIIIDYDESTILNFNKKISYSSTYLPAYKLSTGTETNNYDKFSIGGLYDIINSLRVDFKLVTMPYPANTKFTIDTTNTKTFLTGLNIIGYAWNLDVLKRPANLPYDSIPLYTDILGVLNWLDLNNYVID